MSLTGNIVVCSRVVYAPAAGPPPCHYSDGVWEASWAVGLVLGCLRLDFAPWFLGPALAQDLHDSHVLCNHHVVVGKRELANSPEFAK